MRSVLSYLSFVLTIFLVVPALSDIFMKVEPGEEYPGGKATSRKSNNNANAFSHASANMGFRNELNFKVGNGIFKKIWISSPASTDSSDGLGPLFNARACQRCHLKDGRGHPPKEDDPNDDAITMLMRLSIPPQNEKQKELLSSYKVSAIPDPVYGGQLQDFSIQGHDAEGKIRIRYTDVSVTLGDGEIVTLRKPNYSIFDLKYGNLHKDIRLSPRIAPQMIGLGLLEAIPEETIRKNEDPDDKNGDGISGRVNKVWSREFNKVMIGRFGWKAGQPNIKEQTAAAFAGDMGLSTTLFPHGSADCTDKQILCKNAPNGNSTRYENVEVGDKMLGLVTFYSQNLAVPKRRNHDSANVVEGKKIFFNIGCNSCHVPKFKTGVNKTQKHLSHQLIWPYTDLLLHDMGEGLADGSPEGVANGREWRTAPLWGIGLTKTVNGHTFFLHDGRARNIQEAILWHGGEAEASKNKYKELSKAERQKLIDFVNSL